VVAISAVTLGIVVGVPFAVAGSAGGHSRVAVPATGPLVCPGQYTGVAPWLPDQAAGIDAGSGLVPAATPSSAVVCAYRGSNMDKVQSGWALSGQRQLSGDLAGIAELAWSPRKPGGQPMMCTDMGGPQTNYLLGLTYPDGTEWVSATDEPNGCVGTTNGDFNSLSNAGAQVGASFAAGSWQPAPTRAMGLPPAAPCLGEATGRRGQESQMVPGQPSEVLVCRSVHDVVNPTWQTWTSTTGVGTLAAALNAPAARVSSNGCQQDAHPAEFYEVLFRYATGPPVLVRVDERCAPSVDNGSLQSTASATLIPLLISLR
jgi:hypothetical protein